MIPRLVIPALVLACACSANTSKSAESEPAVPSVAQPKQPATGATPPEVLPARAKSDAMSMQPWHWNSSPVLEPDGQLFIGFSAQNPDAKTISSAEFWGSSRLVLTGPNGATQTLTGDELTAIDSAPDLATGVSSTTVVPLEEVFRFPQLGDYQLRWTSTLGQLSLSLRVLPSLSYLLYRLANDQVHNQWELHLYGEDGTIGRGSLAARLIAVGEPAVPGLRALLDDERPCLIEGSEDATIGSMYGHRRMDYAAILIAEIRKLQAPELRARSSDARDPGIAKVRQALTGAGAPR